MHFDFSSLSALERYKLLSSTITPRPIAWVSTLGHDGRPNAAPFSFFNVFGEDPAVVGFSITYRSENDHKDTGRNVEQHAEFVVNLVSEPYLSHMNITAIEFGPDVNEFAEARLTPLPSVKVRAPRIAESPVSFECETFRIVELGPMRSLVLGKVVMMHVRDEAVIDAHRCHIDTPRLNLIGRMQGNWYVRTSDLLELRRIPVESWQRGDYPDP
jgi:flavin reductase (DIM6/NTAB) family NADH-FMN oxidoreductase RutF